MKENNSDIITDPIYQAARTVAITVENIFMQHQLLAREKNRKDLAHVPPARVIEEIIAVMFWTSLRKEEGHTPRISLAYLPPEQVQQPIIFEHKIPLAPGMLAKIAPGFERAGIYLGVWIENNELYVWGATQSIPHLCFVLDVSEPGLVVIKHRRMEGFGKFANIAVLSGDEFKIVDESTSRHLDCPFMLKSLLDINYSEGADDSVNVLLQLAVSMRSHHRGGTILVVPSNSESWRESIRHPLHYAIAPSFSGLGTLMADQASMKDQVAWQKELNREVDIVAGLTAIDGAIIMNDKYELLAFGEKIKRLKGSGSIEQMMMTEPIMGGEAVIVDPAQNGGTRHLSAAQFVYDQRDAMALVASQDGRFTIFSWSDCENMVQAHRIDALLL
jgi:hypothetical protein